jgi:hypothetical protein
MSSLSSLKETLIKLASASLLHKGVFAEQAIKEAITVIEEHEDRLYKVERYIRGQYAE